MSPQQVAATVALLLVALLCSAASQQQQQQQPPSLDCESLRRVAAAGMRCNSIHQLHLAAVHRRSVLCRMQLQLQQNGSVANIDSELQLNIASISKGMFGAALGIIQQTRSAAGQSSLFTTPLKDIFGEDFWFLDHERSKLVTVDDLLSHSTGLGRHDIMWLLGNLRSKQEVFNRTSRLKATAPFRASFVYNNLVWTIAELTVQRLTGRQSFGSYMRDSLWGPLQMNRTCGTSELRSGVCGISGTPAAQRAAPSETYRHHSMPFGMDDAMRSDLETVDAAGGIVTTLSDMIRYMQYHTSMNYSSLTPPLPHHLPLNGHGWAMNSGQIFHPSLYNESETVLADLPQVADEAYARGWQRSWYRNQLTYWHNGALAGVLCDLNLFPQQNIGIFNHMTLGATARPTPQALFALVFNKHIADLLLRGSSFMTEENVCSLFREQRPDLTLVPLTRRHLTDLQVTAITGEFGNYGFGTATVYMNTTTNLINVRYGVGKLQMHSIVTESPSTFTFLIELLEPPEYRALSVVNRTNEAIYVPRAVVNAPNNFLTIRVLQDRTVMEAAVMQAGMLMEKGLRPESWQRPQLCDSEPNAAAALSCCQLLLLLLLAVVAGGCK